MNNKGESRRMQEFNVLECEGVQSKLMKRSYLDSSILVMLVSCGRHVRVGDVCKQWGRMEMFIVH